MSHQVYLTYHQDSSFPIILAEYSDHRAEVAANVMWSEVTGPVVDLHTIVQ